MFLIGLDPPHGCDCNTKGEKQLGEAKKYFIICLLPRPSVRPFIRDRCYKTSETGQVFANDVQWLRPHVWLEDRMLRHGANTNATIIYKSNVVNWVIYSFLKFELLLFHPSLFDRKYFAITYIANLKHNLRS